jgi:methionyl-tRNA formyltransferase
LSASPVKKAALALGLKVAHDLAALDDVQVEWGIVVAYGAMIPSSVLARTPMLNVHFSLLPRWRGAAPVQRAILAGDEETGVGIISLEPTLDTGPLHAERRTMIDDKSASALTQELAQMGAQLLVEVLGDRELLRHPRAQEGESTYAAKLTPETYHVTLEMNPRQALRVIALERAFIWVQDRRLKILHARASDVVVPTGILRADNAALLLGLSGGAIELMSVQPEGARPMSGAAWRAGARLDDVEWH